MATLSPERVVKEKSEEGGGRFLSLGDHQKPAGEDRLFSYIAKDVTTRKILHIVLSQLSELYYVHVELIIH